MGKNKGQKTTGSKPKQPMATKSTVTEIMEPKPNEEKPTTTVVIGDKKLQRQMEKEAKEEEDRKKALEAAEKAKQNAKNNAGKKKNNKKTPPRAQNESEPTSQPKQERAKEVKYIPENMVCEATVVTPQINKSSSGEWNVEPAIADSTEDNIQDTSCNEPDNMETDNSYQECTPERKPFKINRDFENTSNFQTEKPKQAWGRSDQSFNSNDSWFDNTDTNVSTTSYEDQNKKDQNYSPHEQKTWRGGDNKNSRQNYYGNQRSSDQNRDTRNSRDGFYNRNEYSGPKQRLSEPNYKKQDSYSKFTNASPGYDSRGSFRKSFGNQYEGGKHDKDFQDFWNLTKNKTEIKHGKLNEIKGDLFTASEDYSLAHCVAEDMAMGAGIAKTFRSQFGRVGFLLNQHQKTGGLAVLDDKARYIYYLVTKEQSRGKPTYYTLWQSLNKLKEHMQRYDVTKLALPQIGCGLDRLEWHIVRQMLEHIFRDAEVEIVVYIWDENTEDAAPKKLLKKCAVIHEQMDLLNIESGTGLLYFGTEDGYESEEFKHLAKKYNISATYRQKKQLHDVLKTIDGKEYIYGLIIQHTIKQKIDFIDIEHALRKLKKILLSDKTIYIGFQAFIDETDKYLVDKYIALMQYIFIDVEIWVCWPENLKDYCPQQRRSFY